MSSSCPTTWETLVRIILKAISSSPIISNLKQKQDLPSRTAPVQLKRVYICKQVMKGLLVFVLVPEGFVYPLCDGFAVDDQTFCDWWLETDENRFY